MPTKMNGRAAIDDSDAGLPDLWCVRVVSYRRRSRCQVRIRPRLRAPRRNRCSGDRYARLPGRAWRHANGSGIARPVGGAATHPEAQIGPRPSATDMPGGS